MQVDLIGQQRELGAQLAVDLEIATILRRPAVHRPEEQPAVVLEQLELVEEALAFESAPR
jgi:hypothetical protein